ncbi:DNA polymerase [Cupriavidus plantarum]|uniref:Type-4 uracil-DNA glycosylase n=1 Tax=Cupriavidus plantarum TaxID=942865 RepID=A0A316EYY0_9BURK|nr:DNA polymerase [Cupriavidus plantarum]
MKDGVVDRRARFLEVLGIRTEWVPKAGVGTVLAGGSGEGAEVAQRDQLPELPELPERSGLSGLSALSEVQAVALDREPAFEAGPAEVRPSAVAPAREPVPEVVHALLPQRAADIAAMDWDALEANVAGCTACGLCETRTQTVFGVGDRAAEWMLVGEAPGQNEDLQGEPFVGQAGKLLDNMLGALNLARGRNVFIANVLKCRPPENRDPAPNEVEQCEPYLRRQIALVRPKVIVVLGRFAAQSLLRTTTPIGKLRGTVHEYEGIPVVVTYHPAYLLRTLTDKARAWEDLCLAREVHDRAGAQA